MGKEWIGKLSNRGERGTHLYREIVGAVKAGWEDGTTLFALFLWQALWPGKFVVAIVLFVFQSGTGGPGYCRYGIISRNRFCSGGSVLEYEHLTLK